MSSSAPQGARIDLFRNTTGTKITVKPKAETEEVASPATGLPAGKHINDTPHNYIVV